MVGGFTDFMKTAIGHAPYPYQARLAADGLPETLTVPSGAGKTAGAVLSWLYRRLVAAPELTPRRLVYVLPAHSIAHEVHARIAEWLTRLGRADEVGLFLVAGGAAQEGGWRRAPERSAIVVGTHDLLVSRALMRGLADPRAMAPVSYALLHNDAQWVFDEAHLLGPALATSVSLQRMRDDLGTHAPTATMWMSSVGTASLGPALPDTAGAGLTDEDRSGDLRRRLGAVRRVGRLDLPAERYLAALADSVLAAHVPGTRTIVVVNTLERARELWRLLPGAALVHRHFRNIDMPRIVFPDGTGIVVATPSVEAGFDLTSRTLVTETAPWAALAQRAGRCNRGGEHAGGGDLLWCVPPEGGHPETERWLLAHEGEPVTVEDLSLVEVAGPEDPGPAENDLLDLFDTAPDDVAHLRWVCAEGTAFVAWRAWEPDGPAEDEPHPGKDELCPVPLDDLAGMLDRGLWAWDRFTGYRPATLDDLRPGAILLMDARAGGYLAEEGWAPGSRTPVTPCGGVRAERRYACVHWVSLDQHLRETEEEARALMKLLPGLTGSQREAVASAARYHDLGKCHDAFQEMLRGGGGDPPGGLLAKSRTPFDTGRNPRDHFRHELVSALMLLEGGYDPLVTYLAAAHHGKVRVTVRPVGDEEPLLLGVRDGDRTPPVELSSGERFPTQTLRTEVFGAAGPWTARVRALRDRHDLGPFRLAFLETLVRVADWRASARHDGSVEPLT
jgi:CRISPR-associated endonuclease/helicase Cas3